MLLCDQRLDSLLQLQGWPDADKGDYILSLDDLKRYTASVLEEAAKACEQADADGEGPDCWGWHAKDYAKAIRTLSRQITEGK